MDDSKIEAAARVLARAHGESLGQRRRNLDAFEEMWWRRFRTLAEKALRAALVDSAILPKEPTTDQLDAIVEECRAAWGVGSLPQPAPMMAKHEWRERAKPFYRAMFSAAPRS